MKPLLIVCQYVLVACIGGLLFSGSAFANDESAESLLVPWPMRLQADWWDTYSQADIRQLRTKINEVQAELAFIKSPDNAAQQAQQVSTLFEQYYQKRATPLPVKAPLVIEEKAQYSLAEVQQSVSERRKVESELQLMESRQTLLADELKQKKTAVVTAAIVYKRLQKASEHNLLEGLEWVDNQLSQALVSLNYSVSSQRIKDQQTHIKQLHEQEKVHIERLVVLPETQLKAQQALTRQAEIAKTHQNELARLKETELHLNSNTEQSSARSVMLRQKILGREAALRLAQGRMMANQLILNIASFHDALNKQSRDQVRAQQVLAEDFLKQLSLWLVTSNEQVRQEAALVASIKDVAEKSTTNTNTPTVNRAAQVAASQQALATLARFKQDLALLLAVVETKLSMSARGAEVLVEKADDTIRQSWKKFNDLMVVPLFSMNNTPVNAFGLLNFFLIMFIGWLLTRFFRHAVTRVSERSSKGMQASSVMTLSRIFSVFLLGIALLVGFSSLGIDVTKLALVASALSIGIGFGLQNIINNFVSGIILLFERSMKVGDYIELPTGVVGEVREINIRSTVITTNNNIDIIVPNSEFVNNSVINWTMTDGNLRIKLPFTVAYGCDKDHLREVILEAVLKQPYTLNIIDKHYPQLRLSGFGDNALNFDLVVWIKPGWSKRPGRVKAAYNWVIDDVLREHHFEVPFPQRDIHIRYEDPNTQGLILSSGSPITDN